MKETVVIENLKFDVITTASATALHLLKTMYEKLDNVDKTSNNYIVLILLMTRYIQVAERNDFITCGDVRRLFELLLYKIVL